MTELLAPAGDIEAGYAALAYGADAVYLGLQSFSARAEATNFTPESLKVFTAYAHSLNKKVLVAVNTVFFDEELPALIDTLAAVEDAHADGVIVQDLGTARIIKKHFPSLRLHGSTQMAVHNREGVEALRDLGFKRVVLARELTLDEIKDICAVPGIEKEVFIHGALCYCYSGLCLFSAIYAGRSANRGKCVYPCREAFGVDGETKHVFSMKDMAQSENVLLLKEAGVSALKIEGRKKSALYVAAVTDYYRAILDGEKNKAVLSKKFAAIRTIFSRPTTSLYLTKADNRKTTDIDIVGHRGLPLGTVERTKKAGDIRFIRFKTAAPVARYDGIQIDLPDEERPFGFSAERIKTGGRDVFEAGSGSVADIALPPHAPFIPDGAPVYLASASAVKSAYPYAKPKESDFEPAVPVSVSVSFSETALTASAEGIVETVAGTFSAAKSVETAESSARKAFEKAGGTGLLPTNIAVETNGLFAPMSALNELRRGLYEKVSALVAERRAENAAKRKAAILAAEKAPAVSVKAPAPRFIVKTDHPSVLSAFTAEDWNNIAEVVVEPDGDKIPCPDIRKIRFALPTVLRASDALYRKRIADLIAQGAKKFEIGNIGGLTFLRDAKADISFDSPLYVANRQAALHCLELGASRFTVSPETPDPTGLFTEFGDKACAVVYDDPVLFVSETCPHASLAQKCLKCGGNRQDEMTSRYGKFVSVMKNCRHFLLSEKPRMRVRENAGAAVMRLDFVLRRHDPEKAVETFRKVLVAVRSQMI